MAFGAKVTRRLLHSSVVNLFDHALKIAAVFVVTPLMIRHLGDHGYGLWTLVATVIGYLHLLDLGYSISGTKFMAEAIGGNDSDRLNAVISTLRRFYRRVCIMVPMLSLVAAGIVLLIVKDTASTAWKEVLPACLIFGAALTVRFGSRLHLCFLKAHIRHDLIGVVTIGHTALQTIAMIWVLRSDYGFVALAATMAISEILFLLVLRRLAVWVDENGVLKSRPVDFEENKKLRSEIGNHSRWILLYHLGKGLQRGVDPILIGAVLTPSAIPIYAIGMRFVVMFEDVMTTLFGGHLLSGLAQLQSSSERQAGLRAATRLSATASTIIGASIFWLAPPFIERWIGPDFDLSQTIVQMLAPAAALVVLHYPSTNHLVIHNRQRLLFGAIVAAMVLNVCLSLALVGRFGILGVVTATMIEMLLIGLFAYPWILIRTLGWSTARPVLLSALGSVAFVLAIAVPLGLFVIIPHVQPTYPSVIAHGAMFVGIISIIAGRFLLKPQERAAAFNALPSWLRKRKERNQD